MKAYDLNTNFTFGKYEGKSLIDVFKTDPAYVQKCMMTVDDFAIAERSIQALFEKYPDFEFSDEAVDANLDKLDAIDSVEDDIFAGDEGYADDYEDFGDLKDTLDKVADEDFEALEDDDFFGTDAIEEEDWDDDDDFR